MAPAPPGGDDAPWLPQPPAAPPATGSARPLPSPTPPAYDQAKKDDRKVSLSSPRPLASPGSGDLDDVQGPLKRVGTLGNFPDRKPAEKKRTGSAGSYGPDLGFGPDDAQTLASHVHVSAAALCAAASEGDDIQLETLLQVGHPPNKGDYDRRTALHLAAEEGHLACVEVLVRYGADVNCRDRWGTTPLKGAVQNLQNEVANFLRDQGAKISDDQADTTQYAVHKRSIRQWVDRALQFCGLAPDGDVIPAVGLAGYLYVEHGLNLTKHKALAGEIGPLRKALRSVSCGKAEEDLKKWIAVGAEWTRNLMPPEPPRVPPPKGRQQQQQHDRHKDSNFGSLSCSRNPANLSQDGSSRWSPCLEEETQHDHPMLTIPAGVPEPLAKEIYQMFGRSVITFDDIVLAALGHDPETVKKTKEGGKKSTAADAQKEKFKPGGSPHLFNISQGRLQVPNWKPFVESVLELAAKILEGPNDGKNADYIPELSEDKVDPHAFQIAVCTVDGQQLSIGGDGLFTIQSCGKPFVYAQVVEEYGADHAHAYVGQEPSGRAFNDFALTPKGQPFNAVTNAGAMMTASLYHPEETLQDRTVRYLGRVRKFCGEERVDIDEAVFKSEQSTAYRNHAIANFMMSEGCYPEQVDTIPELQRHVDFYLRTCALRLNCRSLANMAATLAHYGVCPLTDYKCLSFATVKLSLQLAYSCGMYNSSGEWACTVGIPAKSGVSGAIWLAVPGVLGLCVRSPRLDSVGNSVRGVRFSRQFAERFQWGVMDLLYKAKDGGSTA